MAGKVRITISIRKTAVMRIGVPERVDSEKVSLGLTDVSVQVTTGDIAVRTEAGGHGDSTRFFITFQNAVFLVEARSAIVGWTRYRVQFLERAQTRCLYCGKGYFSTACKKSVRPTAFFRCNAPAYLARDCVGLVKGSRKLAVAKKRSPAAEKSVRIPDKKTSKKKKKKKGVKDSTAERAAEERRSTTTLPILTGENGD